MKNRISVSVTALAMAGLLPGTAAADVFRLDPVDVTATAVHPSQEIRKQVGGAFTRSRSSSTVNGSVIQNLNPVNKGDAVRHNAAGLINQPFSGNRFGGGAKIRTFGDWGASRSIDGLPAFKSQGEEGGGYSDTIIPSIAIESISVLKGGRGVGYGDGTDGGVIETTIKSGRNYDNHLAVSTDFSSAKEGLVQGEAADHTDMWDFYAAASWFQGEYDGDPDNLDRQTIGTGLGKFGWNLSDDTRAEFLGIFDDSNPDIIRGGEINEITTDATVFAATVDHRLTDDTSFRVGYLRTDSESDWPARNRLRSITNDIAFADGYFRRQLSGNWRYDGSVGAEYKLTNAERDRQWDNSFNDVSVKTTNAFTYNDNLVLSGGLRQTWFENDIELNGVSQPDNLKDDTVTSYELAASYNVIDSTRIRGLVASGYNRFFEKYGNFGTDALNPLGAGDDIVESLTLEAGVNYAWGTGNVDLAVYNIEQDGVPRRNSGAIESVSVDQTGLEIEAFSYLTPKLTVSAGYMHVIDVEATRADGSKVNSNIFWDGQTASVPTHQASLRADYRLTDEWSFWGLVYYSDGYEMEAADGTVTERRSYYRIDLGTAWQPVEDWTFRFRIENLTDERDFGQTLEGTPVVEAGKLGRVFWVGVDHTF